MKISTRSRYAARALLDIALHDNERPVALKDIAARQEVSEQYLGHLIGPLKNAGLVKSVRGASGGFMLAKDPAVISIGQIVRVMEGSTALVECVNHADNCSRSNDCLMRLVWLKAKIALDEAFDTVNLSDMMSEMRGHMPPAGRLCNIINTK